MDRLAVVLARALRAWLERHPDGPDQQPHAASTPKRHRAAVIATGPAAAKAAD